MNKKSLIKTAEELEKYLKKELEEINKKGDQPHNHWKRFRDEFSSISIKILRKIKRGKPYIHDSPIKDIIDNSITPLIEEYDKKIKKIFEILILIGAILTAASTAYMAFFK